MLSTSTRTPRNRGFTLIEMMVAVAIFAIAMTIALGSLLAMSESNRKAETFKSVINNLNFALESVSRTVRTGTVYHCDVTSTPVNIARDCAAVGASSVAFQSADASQGTLAYCRGNGSTCSDTGTAILRSVNGGAYASITSPEVIITGLLFYVTGAAESPSTIQPKVTILITGQVLSAPNSTFKQTTFNLQTSVTQRLYDR
jgi:prepilin-type N-terminal cleavage/methylation domain-containing protein